MPKPLTTVLKITAADAGQRLDRFLKKSFPAMPFVGLQKLLRVGAIRVNGVKAKADARLNAGDELSLPTNVAENTPRSAAGKGAYQLTKADRALLQENILFEDDALLVLNKPAGIASQAGGGHTRSLDRLLAAAHPDAPPKLAHRLDVATTGVLLCGKTRAAVAALHAQFRDNQISKTYWAILHGELNENGGEIDLPLVKRGNGNAVRAVVDDSAPPARTTWLLLEHLDSHHHLVAATPHTGRFNQLRAHFAAVQLPILGDPKYGPHISEKAPLYLHAHTLTCQHPSTGKEQTFTAPLPSAFADFLKSFATFPENLAEKTN